MSRPPRRQVKQIESNKRLNILLSNGRFPVVLDLARQMHRVGHTVYVVDPMEYHICKFSNAVTKSFVVPVPRSNPEGYVEAIRKIIQDVNIDMIIPMHEEIFVLSQYEDIRPLLFGPQFQLLVQLHSKWDFYKLVIEAGCEAPPTVLCTSMEDLRKLNKDQEFAIKPIFGRAKSGLHHHKPGNDFPEIDFSSEQYVAQNWIKGKEYCSYMVCRNGEIKAAAIYPVIDTIDGSSCVYFKSVEHAKIKEFLAKFAAHYNLTGQFAFDHVDIGDHCYVFECNPRATSGIHLFRHTSWLTEAFTNPFAERHDALEGWTRQLMPGMLMWDHQQAKKHDRMDHVKRLVGTRDVTTAKSDMMPAIMQPFLYTQYMKRCKAQNLQLKELFQYDVVWEPTEDELRNARMGILKRGISSI